MKKTLTLLTLLVAFATWMSAQNVQAIEKTMSLGKQTGVYIEVEGGDKDDLKNLWEDYLKDFGKTKKNKKAKEYYTEGARIPVISSSNSVDVYAIFEEGREQATAYVWAVSDGEFVDDSKGLQTFVQDYYLIARKDVINKEVKEQEKVLKKLDKNMGKLVKKNTGYHKDIEKAEDKIRKAEENIEQNLNDQDEMQAELIKQKEILDMIVEKLNNVGKG